MLVGIFGHVINIIVLNSSKQIRHTPAAFYLMIESVVDIVHIIVPLSARIAINAFDVDLTRTSLAWCRLRQFIASSTSLTAFNFVCYAAFDQYLTTSYYPYIRSLSSMKLAHRLSWIAIVLWPLHGILFLTLNQISPVFGCYAADPIFNAYSTYVYVLTLSGLLPIVVSSTFAILAYYNVRRIVRRQIPLFRRRLDRQLTAMILTRVAFLTIVNVPFIIYRIYSLQVQIDPNAIVHRAVVQLVGSITTQLSYLNSAVSRDRESFSSVTEVLIAG